MPATLCTCFQFGVGKEGPQMGGTGVCPSQVGPVEVRYSDRLIALQLLRQPEHLGAVSFTPSNGPLRLPWSVSVAHLSRMPCNAACRSSLMGCPTHPLASLAARRP